MRHFSDLPPAKSSVVDDDDEDGDDGDDDDDDDEDGDHDDDHDDSASKLAGRAWVAAVEECGRN